MSLESARLGRACGISRAWRCRRRFDGRVGCRDAKLLVMDAMTHGVGCVLGVGRCVRSRRVGVAGRSAAGSRERNRDAGRCWLRAGGSWMIVVADGPSGHSRGCAVARRTIGARQWRIFGLGEFSGSLEPAQRGARYGRVDRSRRTRPQDRTRPDMSRQQVPRASACSSRAGLVALFGAGSVRARGASTGTGPSGSHGRRVVGAAAGVSR